MRGKWIAPTAAAVLLSVAVTAAGRPEEPGRKLVFVEYGKNNRIVEVDKTGKITWEHKTPGLVVGVIPTKDGNVIYAHNSGEGAKAPGIQCVNHENKIVWEYKASCVESLGFDVLPNGNVLLGEEGPCRAVELSPDGKIVSTLNLTTSETNAHRQVRRVHKLRNGNILATHEGEGVVREYDPSGKVVWEKKDVGDVYDARRIRGGNTLITCGKQARVIEVDKDGKIVSEINNENTPGLGLVWPTSIQILPSGNRLICNWLQSKPGTGVHAFEVDRENKVVWKWADHAQFSTITTIQSVE
jgi:outer membrane protein assembly factor BamB